MEGRAFCVANRRSQQLSVLIGCHVFSARVEDDVSAESGSEFDGNSGDIWKGSE